MATYYIPIPLSATSFIVPTLNEHFSSQMPVLDDARDIRGKSMFYKYFSLLFATLLICASAACSQGPTDATTAQEIPATTTPPILQQQQPQADRKVAVTYSFTLRVPSVQVEELQQKHLAECAKAGCFVLNTRVDKPSDGRVSARTSIRISPERYDAFAELLAAPPAEIIVKSRSAEDRTIAVLDVEKRLETKRALSMRLSALLQDSTPKSAIELATIEKELAQVQGDIEAAVAQRDHLKTITETVRVDINYSGSAAVVRGTDFSPIKQALDGAARTLIASIGWLISFIIAALPWIPVIILVAWGVRSGVRRWKRS